jgi:hypothetical protein
LELNSDETVPRFADQRLFWALCLTSSLSGNSCPSISPLTMDGPGAKKKSRTFRSDSRRPKNFVVKRENALSVQFFVRYICVPVVPFDLEIAHLNDQTWKLAGLRERQESNAKS